MHQCIAFMILPLKDYERINTLYLALVAEEKQEVYLKKTTYYHLDFTCLKVDKLGLPNVIRPVPLPDPAGSHTGTGQIRHGSRNNVYSNEKIFCIYYSIMPDHYSCFYEAKRETNTSEANESPFIDAEKSFYIRREFQSFTQGLIYRIINPKHIIFAGNHSNVGFAFFH